MFAFFLGWAIFGAYVVGGTRFWYAVQENLTVFLMLLFGLAASIEIFRAIWPKAFSPMSVLIGGTASYLVYRISEIFVLGYINQRVGIDPSLLPNALSFLTFLGMIPVWFTLGSVLIGIYSIAAFISAFFLSGSDGLGFLKGMARMFGAITIMYFLQQGSNLFSSTLVVKMADQIIFATEFFDNTYCKSIEKHSIVADIGSGLVSVFDKKSDSFIVQKCIF